MSLFPAIDRRSALEERRALCLAAITKIGLFLFFEHPCRKLSSTRDKGRRAVSEGIASGLNLIQLRTLCQIISHWLIAEPTGAACREEQKPSVTNNPTSQAAPGSPCRPAKTCVGSHGSSCSFILGTHVATTHIMQTVLPKDHNPPCCTTHPHDHCLPLVPPLSTTSTHK
jgi:hypothetical protein